LGLDGHEGNPELARGLLHRLPAVSVGRLDGRLRLRKDCIDVEPDQLGGERWKAVVPVGGVAHL